VGGEARFFPRPEAPPAAGFLKRRPKGGEGEAIFGRLQSGNAAGGASPAVGFLKRRPKGDEGEAFFGRRPAGAASPAVGFSKRRPKGDDGEAFFGRLQPGAESPRAGSPFGTLRRAPSAQESHGPFGSAAAPMPAPGDSGFGSSRSAGEREKWSAYWREYWRRHFEAEARGSEARDVRAHPYGTPAPQAVEAGKRRDLRTL